MCNIVTCNGLFLTWPSFFFCFLLVMGHVFANEIQMKDSMDVIKSLAAKENFTDRERLHVEAVKALSAG